MRRAAVGVLLAMAIAGPEQAGPEGPAEPYASVWYRGGEDGTPRQNDLAAIKAYGFAAVTWPREAIEHLAEVRRLAAIVGLHVIQGDAGPGLTPFTALRPSHAVTVPAGAEPPRAAALAWRAVIHGARVVSFDAGEPNGAGLADDTGAPRPWVRPAADVARQLAFNGRLFDTLAPGPDVTVVPPRPAGLDIVLLRSGRLWVLAATNTSAERAHAVAQLPQGVPAALWVDLLDGTEMSMLNRANGPQWTFDLDAGASRLYAIDRSPVPSVISP